MNTEVNPQAETISKSEVAAFCRHMGRSLKGVGSSDVELAAHLMREAEYLAKNEFMNAADLFASVAQTLNPELLKDQAS